MVLSRPFQCPTKIYSRSDYRETLSGLVGDKTWALITSKGWLARGILDAMAQTVGNPTIVIDDVPENPKLSDLQRLGPTLTGVEVVVALGGGSVIDCAKGLVAYQAIGLDADGLVGHLRDGKALALDGISPLPIIAVPTTSGTGSEVTPWGTIWGDDQLKFSVRDQKLYPVAAILDPSLCVSMPEWLTVSSGLDAVSHAMEAVWNNNHTPISDELARGAIEILWRELPRAVTTPSDVDARAQVQIAACMAGFAMGTTNTALCHSISYPFTARHGMPHGFACSFTLPSVAAYNMVENPARLTPIARAMGCDVAEIPERLEAWMMGLNISDHITEYAGPADADAFGDALITRARAANNLRDVDGGIARGLARESLERFLLETEKA